MNGKQDREKRRDERLTAEAKAAGADRRTRLLQLAAGSVFLAIIAVVVGIIVASSGGGSGGDASNLVEKAQVEKLLSGIPQNATVLSNDQTTAWANRTGDDANLAQNAGGGGTQLCLQPHSSNSALTGFNNEASSIKIFRTSTVC